MFEFFEPRLPITHAYSQAWKEMWSGGYLASGNHLPPDILKNIRRRNNWLFSINARLRSPYFNSVFGTYNFFSRHDEASSTIFNRKNCGIVCDAYIRQHLVWTSLYWGRYV